MLSHLPVTLCHLTSSPILPLKQRWPGWAVVLFLVNVFCCYLSWTPRSSMLAILPFLKFILLLTFWTPCTRGFFPSPPGSSSFISTLRTQACPLNIGIPRDGFYPYSSSASVFITSLKSLFISHDFSFLDTLAISKSLPPPQISLRKHSSIPGI